MKKFLLVLIVPIALTFGGCGTTANSPIGGALSAITNPNDAVVINAEKTLAISKETFDTFLKVEYQNKVFVKEHAPAIHSFAEYIRKNAPDWLLQANTLKNQYKHGQIGAAALQAALSVLTTNATKAHNYTTQLNQP